MASSHTLKKIKYDSSDVQVESAVRDGAGNEITTTYVPKTRTINSKALSSDITLNASDVGALSSSTTYVSSVNGNSGAITGIATTSDIPSTYLKSASVSGNTLTLTKQDNTTTTFTPTSAVSSVNGKTGAVSLTASDVSALPSNTTYVESVKSLDTTATSAQTTSATESISGSGTITLHKVSKTGNYNDLNNKPTIPSVNNGTLTIQKNGSDVATFTANQSGNSTANISVPTSDSDLTNNRYVRYDTNSQGLTDTQKGNARTNIGAGTSSFSGSYTDLSNKPTIPTLSSSGNGSITDGTTTLTFGANAFNSTAIPTTYVSSVNGSSGAITNIATLNDIPSVLGTGAQNKDKYLHTNASTGDLEWASVSSSGGITEISTQYIRIWDLAVGIYKLTYNGTKYIYYYGATNTSKTHTVVGSSGAVLLFVNWFGNTGSRKHWWYINGSSSWDSITYGFTNQSPTLTTSANCETKSLHDLLTGHRTLYQHNVSFQCVYKKTSNVACQVHLIIVNASSTALLAGDITFWLNTNFLVSSGYSCPIICSLIKSNDETMIMGAPYTCYGQTITRFDIGWVDMEQPSGGGAIQVYSTQASAPSGDFDCYMSNFYDKVISI